MSYQSEAELEKFLIDNLSKDGYERVVINSEEELIMNFREQLYLHNQEKLENIPLTDKEFDRIMAFIGGKTVFQSAKILRDKYRLEREDGSEVYLEFFDCKKWCKNRFQVTNQTTVVGKYVNRYDVTILINGLPLVQIELKRRGLDIKEAFNQIERYRRHSYQGLYHYIQIFIVTNGVDTKYFANTDRDLSFEYTFFWSDEKNSRITSLSDFTSTFLEKCFVSKVIARYMVINDTDKILMVMRPYQIYAVEALVHRALETNNNGYIWHTTGSGKTLTSFKASQIIAEEYNIKKVFFLVDRKDLDSQTVEEFNKFEVGSVDMTKSTDKLIKQIKEINRPLIVTTIQKMANAVSSTQYEKVMDIYRDEKVVFIIDECHRSQFGDMHKAINKHFTKAQYFGFTGTPRFIENKSQDGRVTADLFEKCLHSYLIKNAINDGNVLGFSVEYVTTFTGEIDESDETKVKAIDTDEVFMADERIELVTNHITQNHNAKTRNGKYCSVFAVAGIPMLIKYYDEFKKKNSGLKITAIFSFGTNEDLEDKVEHSRDSLERIIKDYNNIFDTNYSTDSYTGYFSDISKKMKTGQIDILIVVNMFLTGFDSKLLNTLYVDKNLKYHDLLQAFSRTNRIERSTKPYGNIVCYRNLKHNTDEAIKLFSETDNVDTVLMESYEYYLHLFVAELDRLYGVAETPPSVDGLQSEEEKKQFILVFRELSKLLVRLQSFTEFTFDKSELGISEQTYQDYKSKYLLIYEDVKRKESDKASILDDIDFSIELMHTDKINVDYIMNLLRTIDLTDDGKRAKDVKHIRRELDRADNEELRNKVDLIRSFLEKVVPTLGKEDSIDQAYEDFEDEQRKRDIYNFSKTVDLDANMVAEEIEEYQYSGMIRRDNISNVIRKPLIEKAKITKKVVEYIKETALKYK